MTQISRPFVIALAAVLLFAAVWFVALKPHSSSSGSEAATTPSTPAQSSAAQEKSAAAPSHVDHTSTPGVEGLTRDVNKAHGAVAASQANGKHTEEKAAHASGESGPPPHPRALRAIHLQAPRGASTTSTAPTPAQSPSTAASASPSQATGPQTPAGQANVEKVLKQNKVALVLFWNPKSAEDQAVHLAVQVVADLHHFFEPFANNPETLKLLRSHGIALQEKIAVLESPASEVASYGSFTKTVPVYQTPTILIVNPLGQVSELAGFTDAYVIEQHIGESRQVVAAK